MLGQISLAMGHGGLNIHNMVNKSRGEMAYTLVDVDSPVPEAAVARSPRSKACCRSARYRARVAREPRTVAPRRTTAAGGARCRATASLIPGGTTPVTSSDTGIHIRRIGNRFLVVC
jgi:hypothetical protein